MADLSTYQGRQAARDAAAAAGQHVVVDANGIYNQDTGQTSSGSNAPSGAPAAGGAAPAATGGLDASLQKMLAALASGNAQQFQLSKDEFNKNYELALAGVTGSINGNPTEAVKQFNQQLQQTASQFAQTFGLSQQTANNQNAATVAGLTGYYNAPGAGGSSTASGGGNVAQLTQAYNAAKSTLDQKVATANQAIAAYQADPGNAQKREAASAAQNDASAADQATHQAQDAVYTASQNPASAGGTGGTAATGTNPNGTPTLANIAQQAQLSGQYNGAPTESAREFNQTQAQALLNAATQLRGPADYLQYQNLTHGGQNLMQQLFGNRPAGASAVPAGQLQSANLQNSLGDIGLQQGGNGSLAPSQQSQVSAGMGMNEGGTSASAFDPAHMAQFYAQAMAARNGQSGVAGSGASSGGSGISTAQQSGQQWGDPNMASTPGGSGQPSGDPSSSILMSSFGLAPGSTLNPNQIDPSRWDAMGATGQALTKNLASTMFGYDPNDFEAQVNATRPQGTAQRTSTYQSAAPQGLF